MQWTIKKIKIKDLKENAHNPRRMTKDQASQLKSSIQKFGLCEPIVANIDGSVIGGHQRLKTLTKLGEKEVDVYIPETELSEAESNELNIRLNKNTGEWDFDVLANEWDVNDLINWGFTPADLEIEEKETEEKPKVARITIKFDSQDDLEDAETEINKIVSKYHNASYKVS